MRTHSNRRSFLKTLGGGILILAFTRPAFGQTNRRARTAPAALDAWLRIAPDGTVTFFTGKTEIGQNIRTSLSQGIAEELPMPLESISLIMADTDLVPWDGGTVGSRTTSQMFPQLRRAAAAAREALIDRAAADWKVPRTEIQVDAGRVLHAASGRSAGFGELVRDRPLLREIDESTPLRPATDWKICGTSVPKVNGRSFVTGAHPFTSDLARPGMLHGRILRAPAFGAKLLSLDPAGADRLPGVTVVHEGDFVGVTAPTPHTVKVALDQLRPQWQLSPQVSEEALFAHLRPGFKTGASTEGDSTSGELSHRGTYTVDYIAHVPLEPRAALAEWREGKVTVWTGTQRPFAVREEIAQALRVAEDRVRVIVPDTGSAYGGKHSGEAAVEAARLARAAGAPVKLVWTREEEFTWAYARPAGVMEIASRVRSDGTLLAWQHDNWNSGGSGLALPYNAPSPRTGYHRADSPLRQGSYRALAATANHFARETHIDELAAALSLDPLDFRLRNLTDQRLRDVLVAAAEQFGWSRRTRGEPGRGAGLALGIEKNSVVATCVEVSISAGSGEVKVERVVQAFECGAVINPAHLRGQNEGCIIQGLGGALFERLSFRDGRILNPRLSAYRVPRFVDLPKIEIVLLDRKERASIGGSETPIVGIAPAVGNAIHAATGVRLRALPLAPDGVQTTRAGESSPALNAQRAT